MNENLTCPICNIEFLSKYYFSFKGYSIFTCPACYTRFCIPFVDNSNIYNSDFISKIDLYLDTFNLDYKSIHELKPYIEIENKKVLDIGCGTGSFLEKLKDNNEVLGLEISKSYEPYLIKKRITYKIGDLESNLAQLPDDYYDLITLWDVYEHLSNPPKILSIVKNKLSRNGIIINWTNNYDDFISLFAEMTYRLSFGQLKYFMEQSFHRYGGHNYNFTHSSLELQYKNAGVKILNTIITDTPSNRLTSNIPFRMILEVFYLFNYLFNKGKIICHILTK